MKNLFFILFLTIIFFYGCGDKKENKKTNNIIKNKGPVYGDTYIDASIGDASMLNPLLNSDDSSGNICSLVMDGLLKYNDNAQLEGVLAKKWTLGFNYGTYYIHFNDEYLSKIDVFKQKIEKDIKNESSIFFNKIDKLLVINDFENGKSEIIKIILKKDQTIVEATEIDKNKYEKGIVEYFNKLLSKKAIKKIDPQLTVEFELEQNVKWHDGKKFTADDVFFTYKKWIDKKVKAYNRSSYLKIDSCKVLSPYKISFTYKSVFMKALIMWTSEIIPKHLLENVDLNNCKFNREPIGTGRFKFQKWVSDEYILLIANKEYFKGRPYLDKYMYRVIPDKSTQFQMLQACPNQIDSMGLTPDQFVKQTNRPEFKERFQRLNYSKVNSGYTYMAFNLENPLFASKEIRHAISHSIDKNSMVKDILYGFGETITGPFPPQSWAYNHNVKPFKYDIVKAKEIFEKNGWKDSNNDGILDKDGENFEFNLITNNGNSVREHVCKIIKSDLKKIGIKVNVKLIEWTAYLKMIDNKDFDTLVLGWTGTIEPDPFSIWHSSQIPDMKHGKAGDNFTSFVNKEVDEIIEKSRSTFSREKRKELFYRFHEIIADEQPYVFLYVRNVLLAMDKRIHGIKVGPLGLNDIEKWYVPTKLQRYK